MSAAVLILLGAIGGLAGSLLWSRLAGFLAQRPSDYADAGPRFDIRRDLNGAILCEGIIYGPTGRVTARFVADIEARWTGNACQMTEAFRYDSGAVQDRSWTLTLGEDGAIRATAPDVVGLASGRQHGSALCLHYRLQLPADTGGHVLSVTDWMYLTPNGTIMNRSQFRKLGIVVGELVATMRRVPG